MTLNITLEGHCYINVEGYKDGNNPTLNDVIVIDRKAFFGEQDKIKEWIKNEFKDEQK
jgi:hypothetical protein